MNDLRMGFKHAILQRMQGYETTAMASMPATTAKSPADPGLRPTARSCTRSPSTNAISSSPKPTTGGPGLQQLQPPQVTDFSIERILGARSPRSPPQTTALPRPQTPARRNSSAYQPPTGDILDLSKSSATPLGTAPSAYAALSSSVASASSSSSSSYAAFQQDFLAAAAAANATKFYAQFFPQMFSHVVGVAPTVGGYAHALPTGYGAKRYFAPYVLKPSATPMGSTSIGSLGSSSIGSTSIGSTSLGSSSSRLSANPTLAPPSADVLRPKLCPRDCSECSLYYHSPLPVALPASLISAVSVSATATATAAAVASSTTLTTATATASFLKAKPAEGLLMPTMSSGSPASAAASMISLTTVTNLNLTTATATASATKSSATQLLDPTLGPLIQDEISYKCRICDKVFGCSQTLQAHERTHKSPRYECSDCGKGFSQLRNYKYHLSVHRGTKEFAAECPECGKTFNDKGYLSSHMKIHRNKKEYECPYCPKSFNQRVAFNMHVRIHTGVKPHKCAECGKRFSRKMLLKQHMRTHSGEKPYQCSVCGKSFADRSNMTLHHRLHSGIKPFNCPICPKAFTKKHHLKTHLNYHTGCKPYVCPHPNCNQAFTQSSNMRTHAKKCQYRPLQLSFPETAIATAAPTTTATSIGSAATTMLTPSVAASPNLVFPAPHTMAVHLPTAHGVAASSTTTSSTSSSSAAISAGIRMLSAASFGSQMPTLPSLPPAQQQLVASLRPF